MKTFLKIGFPVALAIVSIVGLGVTQAEALPILTRYCPSLSCLPSPDYTYLGQCDHPCGGMCDYFRTNSGVECYDALCPLE